MLSDKRTTGSFLVAAFLSGVAARFCASYTVFESSRISSSRYYEETTALPPGLAILMWIFIIISVVFACGALYNIGTTIDQYYDKLWLEHTYLRKRLAQIQDEEGK